MPPVALEPRITSVTTKEAARVAAALVRAERRLVAGELHRSPLQLLAAACLRLQTSGGPDDRESHEAATKELQAAMLELRRLMTRLASSDVERSVVVDALERIEAGPLDPAEACTTVDEAAGILAHAVVGRA